MTEIETIIFGKMEDLLARTGPFVKTFEPQQTPIQIDYFIIGNGGQGHPWGMYVQAMRELHTRHQSIIQLRRTLHRNRLDIDEKMNILDVSISRGDELRFNLDLEELVEAKRINEQRFETLSKETERILGHVQLLIKRLGPLTPEKREQYEREYWVHKIKLRVGMCAMTRAAIPEEILVALPLFPRVMREELLAFINDPQKAVASLFSAMENEPLELPEAAE